MGDGSVRFGPLGKFFVNEILPMKICTKCKNNPVSFHPKILHSQRGSTFFFYLLFSSDIPFIEDLQKIIIT